MKPTLIKIYLFLTFGILPFTEILSQLTLTTVSDPLLGSTKIKGISQNQLGETLLLSGKNIYTFVNEVTDVYTCNLCNDIRDVAMVGDTMYIGSYSAGIVKRFADSTDIVTSLRAVRLVSGTGGKLYGVDFLDGIDYFDGTTWQNLKTSNSSIPTNDIYDLAVDQNGLVWFASGVGLISWDGNTFSTKPVPSDISQTFYDIRIDSENAIWVASGFGGIGRYSESTWTTYASTFSPLERVENLAVLHGSEIWTSETNIGFYRYTGTFNTVPFASLGATEWYTNDVLYGDAQNRLWIQNQFTPLRYLTTEPSATTEPTFADAGILIYPNPAFEQIKIVCVEKENYLTALEVYSMEGKLIIKQPIHHQNQFELPIVNWQPGMYMLKVKSDHGMKAMKFNKL